MKENTLKEELMLFEWCELSHRHNVKLLYHINLLVLLLPIHTLSETLWIFFHFLDFYKKRSFEGGRNQFKTRTKPFWIKLNRIKGHEVRGKECYNKIFTINGKKADKESKVKERRKNGKKFAYALLHHQNIKHYFFPVHPPDLLEWCWQRWEISVKRLENLKYNCRYKWLKLVWPP